MQCQINNLQGNFDEAQTRVRILQQNVGLLSNSYNDIFNDISQPCPGFQALPMSSNNSETMPTGTTESYLRQEDLSPWKTENTLSNNIVHNSIR